MCSSIHVFVRKFNNTLFNAILLICVFSITGCSGSGGSSSSNSGFNDSDSGNSGLSDSGSNSTSLSGSDSGSSGLNDSDSNNVGSDSDLDVEPENTSSVIPDPLVQNRSLINFEITVPAYQSDALQVRLTWGDMDMTASWVGDEFWSASTDLPTNTENTLSVTFYDDNGEIELATFETEFRTGLTAAESFQITPEQFDSDQWDADSDGISNIDELNAGTDPSIDEDSLLEIRDTLDLSFWSRMSVSRNFESHISNDRPYIHTFEPEPPFSPFPGSLFGDIEIDDNGNGTVSYGYYWPTDNISIRGTRTRSENSISWEGSRSAYDGDYRHGVSVANTVTIIDENTRGFIEELRGSNIGAYSFTWETNSNLTGSLVDGTSLCKPVAGTFSASYRTSPGDDFDIAAVKEADDPYWRITRVDNDTDTTEYFVRELIVFQPNGWGAGDDLPEDAFFICDFVDF